MTTREVLIKAKALIDTPEKWCQGEFVDTDGRICASAAIARVGFNIAPEMEIAARYALLNTINHHGAWEVNIPGYNDAHTHAEVMEMFDRAIEAQDG